MSNLFSALAHILDIAITILYWLILIRTLVSWVNPDPTNLIIQILYNTTEPFLKPIRKIVPIWNVGIDFSPIVAFLILLFLKQFLVKTLIDLTIRFR